MNTAMILAAGKGTRLRPLTENCPKPLIQVNGKALIEYHIERLARQGIQRIVINVGYLGNQIIDTLGAGEKYGVSIAYSVEEEGPMGVVPGLKHARSLLGNEPFLLVSADIWIDSAIPKTFFQSAQPSHLLLVQTKRERGYGIDRNHAIVEATPGFDYAGIARINPNHLATRATTFQSLIDSLTERKEITGEIFKGQWYNVGTPDVLEKLNNHLKK